MPKPKRSNSAIAEAPRSLKNRGQLRSGFDGDSTLVPNIEFSPGQVPQGMSIAAARLPAGARIANSTALFRIMDILIRNGYFLSSSRLTKEAHPSESFVN